MIRSTVCEVDWVCRVAKTRCPVSAAVRAVAIVSRSRISPTRMSSGSSRRAARRPRAKSGSIGADLALVDDRLFVFVQELDRVLDREDVVRAFGVDHVEHRRQRRALAGAGRAGDEDEPTRFLGQLTEDLRHPERVEVRDLLRDEPERGADRAALEEAVDAEPGDVGDRVGEVELFVVLEPFPLVLVEDAEDDVAGLLARRARGSRPCGRSFPFRGSQGGTPGVRWTSEALASTIRRSTSEKSKSMTSLIDRSASSSILENE